MSRKGVGKLRHIEVRRVWLQDLVEQCRIMVHKVQGTINPSDLLTKPFYLHDIHRLSALANLHVEDKGHSLKD